MISNIRSFTLPLLCAFCAVSLFAFTTSAADRSNSRSSGDSGSHSRGSGGASGEASVRWTLADWLTQKQKFKLEDQWLAMHQTQGRIELDLGGGGQTYTYKNSSTGTSTSQTTSRYSADIFYSIFGLSYEYESSNEDWVRQSGGIKIRLLGTHSRSSFLNIGGGERTWKFTSPASSVNNTYAQAELNLYIFSFFGIEGQYNQYFKATDNTGATIEGTRFSYGAFIEFGPLRVGGRLINDSTTVTPSGATASTQSRDGSEIVGALIF